MTDRLRVRAALTVLLVVLTVAGIQAARPVLAWHGPSRGLVVAVGCALEAALAVLLFTLRFRRQPGTHLSVELRRILNGVLVSLLAMVAIATAIIAIGKIDTSVRRQSIKTRLGRPRHRVVPLGHSAAHSFNLPVVRDILAAILIAAIIVVLALIWRWRSRPIPKLDDMEEHIADTPAELARAVESGLRALAALDDARAAIIGCYLAMEKSLAEAGAVRGVAETPDELLARAVAERLVHSPAAARLTALFYEARFSTHPMASELRLQAEHALAELAAALPVEARP